MAFKLKKLSGAAILILVTSPHIHATPNAPTDAIPDWLIQQEQQKTVEPCESYPNCYDPPPFAPEPTEPEEEKER